MLCIRQYLELFKDCNIYKIYRRLMDFIELTSKSHMPNDSIIYKMF